MLYIDISIVCVYIYIDILCTFMYIYAHKADRVAPHA